MGCHSLLQRIFLTQGLNQVSYIASKFFTVWATGKSYVDVWQKPKQYSKAIILQSKINKKIFKRTQMAGADAGAQRTRGRRGLIGLVLLTTMWSLKSYNQMGIFIPHWLQCGELSRGSQDSLMILPHVTTRHGLWIIWVTKESKYNVVSIKSRIQNWI